MRGTKMNDSIQNTKELIISYFNNNEDYFSFSLEGQAKPSDKPTFLEWSRQENGWTSKEYGVLIDDIDDNDIKPIIILVRDKNFTKIGAYVYNFYKGCLAYYDIYKIALFNSACKYARFIIGDNE